MGDSEVAALTKAHPSMADGSQKVNCVHGASDILSESFVDMGTAMSRTPMLQTYGSGKASPR